jgi:hypothetical protein
MVGLAFFIEAVAVTTLCNITTARFGRKKKSAESIP